MYDCSRRVRTRSTARSIVTGYTPVRGQCCEPLKPEPGPGDELRDLLAAVGHVPGQDTLILVGDLVNKGPKSAARFALVY